MTQLKRYLGYPRKVALIISAALLLSGSLLVLAGEWQKRLENREFGAAQVAMRQAIGVFDNEVPGASDGANAPDPSRINGILDAPNIGLSVVIVDYEEYDDLETAVARMGTSAALGQPGSSVIVGHRTGFGQPFFDLDRLKIGQEITVTLKDESLLHYEVARQEIVSPLSNLSEFDNDQTTSQLILVTCHPKYSTKERLVIVATLSDDPSQ
jgi:sortase A